MTFSLEVSIWRIASGKNGFALQLLVTQYIYENDSFDNTYDENANYYGEVRTAQEMATPLANSGTCKVIGDIEIAKNT